MFFLVRQAAGILIISGSGAFILGTGVLACILLGCLFIFGAGWWAARPEVRLVAQMFKRNPRRD